MTKLGKALIQAAKEAQAIARGEADPSTYRVHTYRVHNDIDALIERLRLLATEPQSPLSLEAQTMNEAADAIAELRDDLVTDLEAELELHKAQAEIAKLQARLEIDHCYVGPDMRREEVPPEKRDSFPDGIEARDCTIKMQDEQLVKQQGQIGELWLENSRLKEALEDCVSFMCCDICGPEQKRGILKEARAALGEEE